MHRVVRCSPDKRSAIRHCLMAAAPYQADKTVGPVSLRHRAIALQHVFTVVHRRRTKVARQRLTDIREGLAVTQ